MKYFNIFSTLLFCAAISTSALAQKPSTLIDDFYYYIVYVEEDGTEYYLNGKTATGKVNFVKKEDIKENKGVRWRLDSDPKSDKDKTVYYFESLGGSDDRWLNGKTRNKQVTLVDKQFSSDEPYRPSTRWLVIREDDDLWIKVFNRSGGQYKFLTREDGSVQTTPDKDDRSGRWVIKCIEPINPKGYDLETKIHNKHRYEAYIEDVKGELVDATWLDVRFHYKREFYDETRDRYVPVEGGDHKFCRRVKKCGDEEAEVVITSVAAKAYVKGVGFFDSTK